MEAIAIRSHLVPVDSEELAVRPPRVWSWTAAAVGATWWDPTRPTRQAT